MWRDKHKSDTAPSFRIEPKELQDRKTHGKPRFGPLFAVIIWKCGRENV